MAKRKFKIGLPNVDDPAVDRRNKLGCLLIWFGIVIIPLTIFWPPSVVMILIAGVVTYFQYVKAYDIVEGKEKGKREYAAKWNQVKSEDVAEESKKTSGRNDISLTIAESASPDNGVDGSFVVRRMLAERYNQRLFEFWSDPENLVDFEYAAPRPNDQNIASIEWREIEGWLKQIEHDDSCFLLRRDIKFRIHRPNLFGRFSQEYRGVVLIGAGKLIMIRDTPVVRETLRELGKVGVMGLFALALPGNGGAMMLDFADRLSRVQDLVPNGNSTFGQYTISDADVQHLKKLFQNADIFAFNLEACSGFNATAFERSEGLEAPQNGVISFIDGHRVSFRFEEKLLSYADVRMFWKEFLLACSESGKFLFQIDPHRKSQIFMDVHRFPPSRRAIKLLSKGVARVYERGTPGRFEFGIESY